MLLLKVSRRGELYLVKNGGVQFDVSLWAHAHTISANLMNYETEFSVSDEVTHKPITFFSNAASNGYPINTAAMNSPAAIVTTVKA